MSLQFPASPVTGQVFPSPLVPGAPSWTFDGSKWVSGGFSGAVVSTSPLPPTNPRVGDLWFDPSEGQMYVWFDDGVTAQWVVTINQTGQTNMVPEPPQDGQAYLRTNGTWIPMTSASAALSANSPLTAANTWSTGPSVNVGTVGTWFVSAQACVGGAAAACGMRIWDGVTTISGTSQINITTAGVAESMNASGLIMNPSGSLSLQCRANLAGVSMYFDASGWGLSRSTQITAMRIG